MPAIFLGHGNPMNALADNEWTRGWRRIGETMPRPKAVLCISAHWYLQGTLVGATERPKTIHDFGGFPKELFEFQYPAAGDPALAGRVQELLAPLAVRNDTNDWGLDHGAWSVLCHVYPQADVPVVQLSIDEEQPPAVHFEIGKLLAPLRDEGVLIVGSGNVVHNLHAFAWGRHSPEPYDWALRFDNVVRHAVETTEFGSLIDYESLGKDAMLSAPTPDHFLPLLYVLGAAREDDRVSGPVAGFDGGSISMLSIQMG